MSEEQAVEQEPIPDDMRERYEDVAVEVAEAIVRTYLAAGLAAKWKEMARGRGGVLGKGEHATQASVNHSRDARANGEMVRNEIGGAGRVHPKHTEQFCVLVNQLAAELRALLDETLKLSVFP